MSRVGNTLVHIPEGVTVTEKNGSLIVVGPKGQLSVGLPTEITLKRKEQHFAFSRMSDDKRVRALHGLVRASLQNTIVGVTNGWTKTLELVGVGYRATMNGENLVLTIGFSHSVTFQPESGIRFTVADGKIVVSGIDKHQVGQTAANIRSTKKPEPYKGKGIRYSGEYIRKKAGKSAKAVGGSAGAK